MASKVDAKDIKKLREMSGAGMVDCKKALVEFDGDLDKAVDALRARGIVKAAKRLDRDTTCGRVFSYIHAGGMIGVLLQLNCETDFVAKNDDFGALGKDLCMQVAAANPIYVRSEEVSQDVIDRETAIYREQLDQDGKKPEQIEKILPGKLKKFYTEVCLLEQPFIKDSKVKVEELVKQHIAKVGENISIGRFSRYQVG